MKMIDKVGNEIFLVERDHKRDELVDLSLQRPGVFLKWEICVITRYLY